MTALTLSDYQGALDVLRVAHESDGPLSLTTDVMAALRRVIPSAMATYHEYEPSRGYAWALAGADDADVAPIWSRYDDVRHQDPLPAASWWGGAGRLAPVGAAIRFADVLSLRQLRRLDLHAEVCRPLGIDHVMKLFIEVGDAGFGFVVLDNERRPFSDRDRALLDVLAPHFALVRMRHLRLRPALDAEVATALTPREAEILRLVASGMTNREVAGALFISPGTVRKHLENAYAKLGVRSRAQAVAVLARIDAATP